MDKPLQKTAEIFRKMTKPPRRWVRGVRAYLKLRIRREKRQNRELKIKFFTKKNLIGSPDSFGLPPNELPDIPSDAPLPTIRGPKSRLCLRKGRNHNSQADNAQPSTSRDAQPNTSRDIPKSSPGSTPARYYKLSSPKKIPM